MLKNQTEPVRAFTAKGINSCGIERKGRGYSGPASPDGFVLQETEVSKRPGLELSKERQNFKRRRHEDTGREIPYGGTTHGTAPAREGPGGNDRIEKKADFFLPAFERSVQFFKPAFIKWEIMSGDYSAEANPNPRPKAFPQESKTLVVASIAKKIVNGERAVQADFKTEPWIKNKGIRQPGGKDAVGYDLYLTGMAEGGGEDFGQVLP